MNAYAVLGLHFDATKEDVTVAYRKLVKSCHPDLHPDDPKAAERFKELSQAYRTLIEELKRPQERHRKAKEEEVRTPPIVATIKRSVVLNVYEAMTGCRKQIEGIAGPCQGCSGSGRIPTQGPVECVTCLGTGIVKNVRSGFINLSVACGVCSGTGKINWFTCHECTGYGTVNMDACDVDIPPGTHSGDRLVVPGGANNPRENIVGDVEITVVIKDPNFRIVDNDIETHVAIELWEATLGATIPVALPSGEVFRLAVPPETPHGGRFRIKGRGLNYTEERGDLVVVLKIRIPKLSEPGVMEAMEALKEAAGTSTTSAS